MPDGYSLYAAWEQTLLSASVQGALGILAALLVIALFPRLSGAARSWLWRLAFARVLIGLFWAAPLPLLQTERAPEAPAQIVAVPPSHAVAPAVAPAEAPTGPAAGEVLALCWLLGLGWCFFRGIRQVRAAARLRSSARLVTDARTLACWQAAVASFELRRPPELREAEGVHSPLLLQVRNPVVILPARLADVWAPEQMQLMFAHELAHLRRHDLLWGWLPATVHGLFFFHPLVWLANREWRLAHDMAADELALARSGASPAEYARMLLRFAVFPPSPAGGLALMDARESAATLERRLKGMSRLVNSNPRRRWLSWAPALLLGAAVVLPIHVTATQAQSVPEERPADRVTDRVPAPPATPDRAPSDREIERQEKRDRDAAPRTERERRGSDVNVKTRPVPAPRSRARDIDEYVRRSLDRMVPPDGPSLDERRKRFDTERVFSRDTADLRIVETRPDPAAASDVARRSDRVREGDDATRIRVLEERLQAVERQLRSLIEQNDSLRRMQGDFQRGNRRVPSTRSSQDSDGRAASRRAEDREAAARDEAIRAAIARDQATRAARRAEGDYGVRPGKQFLAHVRLYRHVDGEVKILADSRLMLIDGDWAEIEIANGRPTREDASGTGKHTIRVRVTDDERTGQQLVDVDWKGAKPLTFVNRPGRVMRVEGNSGGADQAEITVDTVRPGKRR